jgi:hypothetical protein
LVLNVVMVQDFLAKMFDIKRVRRIHVRKDLFVDGKAR